MKPHYTTWPRIARFLPSVAGSTWRARGKRKVFCVGKNKTGTTSVARALSELGLILGNQYLAELLLHDWARRDFCRIIHYCYTAQAFQDVPFSLADTFRALDQCFPGSKFILTVRDSPEQWYSSLTNYHAALFVNGHIPTLADLKAATYLYPGFAYEANRLTYDTPSDDPYNRDWLIAHYQAHNQAVMEHFGQRPGDLLVLNVAVPGAYDELCAFLGKPETGQEFPWENRTANVQKTGSVSQAHMT